MFTEGPTKKSLYKKISIQFLIRMRDILSRKRRVKRNIRSLDHLLKSKSLINTCLIRDKMCFFCFFCSYLLSCLKKIERQTHTRSAHGAPREYRTRQTSVTCHGVDRRAVRSWSVLVIGEGSYNRRSTMKIAMFSPSFQHSAPYPQYRRLAPSSSCFVRAFVAFEYYHSQ